MILNAALEAEIKSYDEKVERMRADRKLLLNKLLAFEKIDTKDSQTHQPTPHVNSTKQKSASRSGKIGTKSEPASGKRKKPADESDSQTVAK